ncbi:hypothetical protein ACT3R9_03230, partial [Psychrobacter sp. AOP42-A1-21]
MLIKISIDEQKDSQLSIKYFRTLLNKELLIASYFLLFIFGITTQNDYNFYNEYKVIQIVLLLVFGLSALSYSRLSISKAELFF